MTVAILVIALLKCHCSLTAAPGIDRYLILSTSLMISQFVIKIRILMALFSKFAASLIAVRINKYLNQKLA